jgi:chromosome partitioning protein
MLTVTANQKGGVGKSTIAVHLATWLFDRGYTVALLDLDKQLSSSQWIAEVEPKIRIEIASTPEETLAKARGLTESFDFVVADGPGGIDDVSRTVLILADLALLPISPSILDLRSVQQATSILRYAQGINRGKPEGCLVLNKMRTRDTISKELREAAPTLGVRCAEHVLRDLQAYRDAAQQGTVVGRMKRKNNEAARDIDQLFFELMDPWLGKKEKVGNA